jgi:hypothetical protein
MKNFNRFSWPPWLRQVRIVCVQVIIPITIFQGVRTIFFPTPIDVILLAIFVLIAVALHLEWI